jgi:DNA-binding NarL/FixJ family response regulator
LATSPIRVLVVDDHEPFQRFVASILQQHPELQIIGRVNGGLAAVQKAQELRPDLIVLDIGLPTLNGIEAARRIRTLSPYSKILFLSQESSLDLVQEAFDLGAYGYVVKTDAGSQLSTAISTVVRGERFVSRRIAAYDLTGTSDARPPEQIAFGRVLSPFRQRNERIVRRQRGAVLF